MQDAFPMHVILLTSICGLSVRSSTYVERGRVAGSPELSQCPADILQVPGMGLVCFCTCNYINQCLVYSICVFQVGWGILLAGLIVCTSRPL